MIIDQNDYNMLILKLMHASSVSELLISDSECHGWGGHAIVGGIGAVAQSLEEVSALLARAKIKE